MKKHLTYFLYFLFFSMAASAQDNGDTIVLKVSKITNTNRIIIMNCCYTAPSFEGHLRKHYLEACVSAINSTIKVFEYFDTYDDSKLDEAENFLKLSRGLVTGSNSDLEPTKNNGEYLEKEVLDFLEQFIKKIKTINESEADRFMVAKIQKKYFHASKNTGVPSLNVMVMLQARAQVELTDNLKMK